MPDSSVIKHTIAEVLLGDGINVEQSRLNNTVQERLKAKNLIESIGGVDLARSIYLYLGFMVDEKYVWQEPIDSYGQTKYRLTNKGRIRFFGSKWQIFKDFLGTNWLTILIGLGNATLAISLALIAAFAGKGG